MESTLTIVRRPEDIDREIARAHEVVEAPAGAYDTGYAQGVIDSLGWLTGAVEAAPKAIQP